jgi:small conductance mechanosensitive channel
LPIQQWTVGREMNRRIKKKFDEVGIEIPFPHMSIYFGEASKPFRLQMEGSDREQLKSLIREVQQEGKA